MVFSSAGIFWVDNYNSTAKDGPIMAPLATSYTSKNLLLVSGVTFCGMGFHEIKVFNMK